MVKNEKIAKSGLNQAGKKRLLQVFLQLVLMALLLFVSAGRLDWTWAWVNLGVWLIMLLISTFILLRINPEVINERGRKPENQKDWDRTLMKIYGLFSLSALVVAGLDAGRFGWSGEMPLGLHLGGIILGILSYTLTSWTMLHNPFLSQQVVVQEERGHQVATSGPYQFVRHPMYFSILLSWVAYPLMLGSLWMWLPGTIAIGILIRRTILEDITLQEELDGYKEYASKVRYRLVPGMW